MCFEHYQVDDLQDEKADLEILLHAAHENGNCTNDRDDCVDFVDFDLLVLDAYAERPSLYLLNSNAPPRPCEDYEQD